MDEDEQVTTGQENTQEKPLEFMFDDNEMNWVAKEKKGEAGGINEKIEKDNTRE